MKISLPGAMMWHLNEGVISFMGNGGRAILFLMGVVIQKYMYRGSGCPLMEERPKGRCFSPPQHASTRSTIYRDKCSLGHSALSHSSQQFGSACYQWGSWIHILLEARSFSRSVRHLFTGLAGSPYNINCPPPNIHHDLSVMYARSPRTLIMAVLSLHLSTTLSVLLSLFFLNLGLHMQLMLMLAQIPDSAFYALPLPTPICG